MVKRHAFFFCQSNLWPYVFVWTAVVLVTVVMPTSTPSLSSFSCIFEAGFQCRPVPTNHGKALSNTEQSQGINYLRSAYICTSFLLKTLACTLHMCVCVCKREEVCIGMSCAGEEESRWERRREVERGRESSKWKDTDRESGRYKELLWIYFCRQTSGDSVTDE